MSFQDFWYENDSTFWRVRSMVIFWVGVLLILGTTGGVIAYGRATWWEDHKTERGRGDAPVDWIAQDDPDNPVYTVEMPDDFGNFASRCVWEGIRAFSTSNDGGAFFVTDERCEQPHYVRHDEVDP